MPLYFIQCCFRFRGKHAATAVPSAPFSSTATIPLMMSVPRLLTHIQYWSLHSIGTLDGASIFTVKPCALFSLAVATLLCGVLVVGFCGCFVFCSPLPALGRLSLVLLRRLGMR